MGGCSVSKVAHLFASRGRDVQNERGKKNTYDLFDTYLTHLNNLGSLKMFCILDKWIEYQLLCSGPGHPRACTHLAVK